MTMTAENIEPNEKQIKQPQQPKKPEPTEAKALPKEFLGIKTYGEFILGSYNYKKQKWDKRPPEGTTWKENFRHSLITAQHKEYFGFKLEPDHNLVVIDVDEPNSTEGMLAKMLLEQHPTYAEYSVSSTDAKPCFKAYYRLSDETAAQMKEDNLEKKPVEIFRDKPIMLTGQSYNDVQLLGVMSQHDLDLLWPDWRRPLDGEEPVFKNQAAQGLDRMSLIKLQEILNVLPCDFDANPKLQFACSKLDLPIASRYNWWCTVLAILRNEQQGRPEHEKAKLEDMGLNWSQKDEAHFDSEKDYRTTFKSFNRERQQAQLGEVSTIGTLLRVRKNLKPKYTHTEIVGKEENKREIPIIQSAKNLDDFFEWSDLVFHRDVYKRELRFEGPEFLLGNFSTKMSPLGMASIDTIKSGRLNPATVNIGLKDMLQTYSGFRVKEVGKTAITDAKEAILGRLVSEFNPILDYALEGGPYIPHNAETGKGEPDYIAQYLACFKIDIVYKKLGYESLMKSYLRKALVKWYHQMLGQSYGTADNKKGAIIRQGWPILIGKERIGKSVSILKLLPSNLRRDYFAELTVNKKDKSMTELDMKESQHAVVSIDEVDQFLKDNSASVVKNRVSVEAYNIRDLYQNDYQNVPCQTLVICSTNSDTLHMSRNGNRRLWCIVLEDIDLDAMDQINLQRFHAQLAYLGQRADETYQAQDYSNLDILGELTDKEKDSTEGLTKRIESKTAGDTFIGSSFDLTIPWPLAKEKVSTKHGKGNPLRELKGKWPNYDRGGFVGEKALIRLFSQLNQLNGGAKELHPSHVFKIHRQITGSYTQSQSGTKWGTILFRNGVLINPNFNNGTDLYYVPQLSEAEGRSDLFE